MPQKITHARNSHASIALAALLFAGAVSLGAPTAALAAAPAANPSLDSAALVNKLADELRDYFVFPDVALRYGAAIRARHAAGAYAAISDPGELAKALTADLQAVAKDGHLRVFPPAPAGAAPGGGPVIIGGPGLAGAPMAGPDGGPVIIKMPRPDGAASGPMLIKRPPAIPASGWLADGVAYIRFDGFPGDPETLAQVDAFVAAHAGARTLIIDARGHRGGGLDEMDHLFPHLFKKPESLVMMDTRAKVEADGMAPLNDSATLLRQTSPDTVVRRLHVVKPASQPLLGDARVYLLTSRRTGSAGEHLALALKRTHRATLVGEVTMGAGNFGGEIELPGGFSAFVPGGQSYDPASGAGWEGVGVKPDVAVPTADALNKALELAGVDPTKVTKPPGVS